MNVTGWDSFFEGNLTLCGVVHTHVSKPFVELELHFCVDTVRTIAMICLVLVLVLL